jgi:hypothetical protein
MFLSFLSFLPKVPFFMGVFSLFLLMWYDGLMFNIWTNKRKPKTKLNISPVRQKGTRVEGNKKRISSWNVVDCFHLYERDREPLLTSRQGVVQTTNATSHSYNEVNGRPQKKRNRKKEMEYPSAEDIANEMELNKHRVSVCIGDGKRKLFKGI